MFSLIIAVASAIALVSAQDAKPEVYWTTDLRTLTGASDATWLTVGNGVVVRGDKVAVTTQDCSLIVLSKDGGQEGTVYSHTTTSDDGGCMSAPIIAGKSFTFFFMYTTNDGNVIAVNMNGTEAWKTKLGIGRFVSLTKVSGGVYAARNAGDGAYITYINALDGSVDQSRSVHIPNITMQPLSAAWSGFLDLNAPEWFYFTSSSNTGGIYSLHKLVNTDDAAEVELVTTLNNRGSDFTPIVSNDHDSHGYPYSYSKVWPTLVSRPAGFIGKTKSEPDWQFTQEDADSSASNGLTLTEEGNICFCLLHNCWCVDSEYGTVEWKSDKLVESVYVGNPNLYVPSSHTADSTLLINNLYSQGPDSKKVISVNPATGEVLWQLNCDDFTECTADQGEGGGSMDHDDDGRVYFSPFKFWVVATAARLSDAPPPLTLSPVVTTKTPPVSLDPTDPVTIDPTDPVTIDPTDPVTIDPTDPVTIDPTDPVTIDPTDPVTIDPTDPLTIDPTDPVTIEPTDATTTTTTDSAGSGSSCKICENCSEEIKKDNITEIVLAVVLVLAIVAIVVLAVLLCKKDKGFSALQRGSAELQPV